MNSAVITAIIMFGITFTIAGVHERHTPFSSATSLMVDGLVCFIISLLCAGLVAGLGSIAIVYIILIILAISSGIFAYRVSPTEWLEKRNKVKELEAARKEEWANKILAEAGLLSVDTDRTNQLKKKK